MTKRGSWKQHARRASWASGAAIGALLLGISGVPQSAHAVCTNTGAFPNITAFTCTGNDTDGHSIGTFVLGAPATGNNLDITSSMAAAATISNAAGSPALSVVMDNGADWTFTSTDPNNTIQSVNANGIRFGTRAANSVVTINYAGSISTINSNAVSGLTQAFAANGNTVNLTFQSTAQVTSTGGTSDILGVPTSGGGVVLANLGSGAVNWTVTNHGTFQTTNDSIYLVNLLGSGTHTINNDGSLGTQAAPSGGSSAVIFAPLAGSTGTINNNNGTMWATGNAGPTSDFGAAAVVVGGNAQVTNLNGNINTVNDPGILAVSLLGGTATVNSTGGSVTSTNGPGIVGISVQSTSTVDAGTVTAGSDPLSLFGFTIPVIPGFPALSGGVFSLANGNAIANAHGNVTTTGSFGVLALSLNGAATATSDPGIAIDPTFAGMAAVVLDGTDNATVNNNAATVDSDLFGLFALNLGDGHAIINSSGSVVNAPIAATSVSTGSDADAVANNTNSGVWNGAVVLAGGRDALLTNTVNSQINLSGSAVVMLAERDAIITNDTGSDINFTGINLNLMVAGRDAIIRNDRGSNINLVGINANVMVADRDAIIDNDRGANINLVGINGNFMIADRDAIINNDDGATINLVGINGNLMVARDDATINNEDGATINLIGLNTLGFVAGGDSTINNDSTINVSGFATILGLETFNNSGILDMRNGTSDYDSPVLDLLAAPYGNGVGDVTAMTNVPIINENTQFNGGGQLGIDAFLRGSGADSSSDLLLIGGSVNGTTRVLVNDTNLGAGAFNPTGILFAHADGANPGTFKLQNGPIDKGFFDYDIFKRSSLLDPDPEANDWVLASYPNGRGFELPKLITGAQTIWYESSGVWLDRTADLRRQLECAPALAPTPVAEPLKVAPSDDAYAAGAPCVQQRYGVWARGFGGDFSRDKTDRTSLLGVTKTSNGDYDQDLWGIEGGADIVISRPNSGYGALFAGVLGGFVQSDMEFNASRDKAEYDGGMVGGYLTYLAGGWYNDLLFKADLLSVDYKTTFLGAKASPDIDSFGIRYDTGYRFNLGSGFFVDPQGTIAWVETDTDNVTLLNTVVNFSDGESVRGRLGGRVGYSTMWGATIVEPFFVGSFWHEFEGDNKATLTSGANISIKDELDDSWGELGGGVNFFTSAKSSVFVKADALVGGDLEGWNVKGGGRLAW